MEISLISPDLVTYVQEVCSLLKCTPQVLVEDALRIHQASFRVINHSIISACQVRDVETKLNS